MPVGNTAKKQPPTSIKKAASPSPGTSSSQQNKGTTDEIVFETFYHKSGKTFCCMYNQGIRYYLDSFSSGNWTVFPYEWYNEGVLVTNEIQTDDGQAVENAPAQNSESKAIEAALAKKSSDRSGKIKIPGKGIFETYIFEHRRNIHCYYDQNENNWIKLPIKWELMTPLAQRLIPKIQEVVPQWHDEADIMASLRVSNYNIEDCVNTYHATIEATEESSKARAKLPGGGIGREKSIIAQTSSIEKLEKRAIEAEKKIKQLESDLKSSAQEKDYLHKNIQELEEKMAGISAENQTNINLIAQLQKNRPKTAAPAKATGPSAKEWKALNAKIKELRKVQIQLKAESDEQKKYISDLIKKAKEGVLNLEKNANINFSQIDELRALYRAEAEQRKLLYNQLQELRGNIRVFCRIRRDDAVDECLRVAEDETNVVVVTQQTKKVLQFDKGFGTKSTQKEIYEEVQPIITSCADGYNVCILAYGQTGSGKTYTMQGPDKDPGVNVRAIKELLKICQSKKDTIEFQLTISMVEIYNEVLQDLLTPKVSQVEIRAQGNKVEMTDLTNLTVKTEKDIMKAIEQGANNRKVASTKMNSTSSRSHLLVIFKVVGTDKVSRNVTAGQLTLVDLAGSERVSKTEAEGARLTEAAFINKSLTSLGQVFSALRSNQLHIPYRNSKLTHILQPSLGGDAKACLFVNVRPDATNISETMSTLQFGANARQVALGQAKRNVQPAPPPGK